MYHNVDLAWEPKIIGVKNGIYQVELDKKFYDEKTYQELESLFIGGEFSAKQSYPDVNFKFVFKKLKSAKKTSFMSFTPHMKHAHFLVDERVISMFRQFNIQRHNYYEAIIYDSPNENIDTSYSLFYSVLQDWDVIDFENTVFTSGGYGNNPKTEHSFKDVNDMRNFNGITKVKILALSEKFDTSLDFFYTRLGGYFVSEKLRFELKRLNLTGIRFTDEVEILNV